MLKLLKNDNGGAELIYILFIFSVVLSIGSVMLTMTSNTHLHSLTSLNQKKADYMAVGGMESFLLYLKGNTGSVSDKLQHFKEYNWFSNPINITQTQGDQIYYDLTLLEDGTKVDPSTVVTGSNYIVQVTAKAGQGNLQKQKTLKYELIMPSEPSIIIDPDTPSTPLQNQIIYGASSNYSDSTNIKPIRGVIEAYINELNRLYPSSCNSCNPVVERIGPQIISSNKTWGINSSPKLFIVDGNLTIDCNNCSFTVYGNLLINGNIVRTSNNSHSDLQIEDNGSGKFGNLIVESVDNQGVNNFTISTDRDVFILNDFRLNNNYNISAGGSIAVGGILNLGGGSTSVITGTSGQTSLHLDDPDNPSGGNPNFTITPVN